MTMITCSACGGQFPQPQPNGFISVHNCPSLSEPQALAASQGITVAELAKAQGTTGLVITAAAEALVGMPQDWRIGPQKRLEGKNERRVYVSS